MEAIRMSPWDAWLKANVDRNRLKDHPTWSVADVWTLVRDDGLLTAHKAEAPFCSWSETMGSSRRLADKYIPMGAELPEGMRGRADPNYGVLWAREEAERGVCLK